MNDLNLERTLHKTPPSGQEPERIVLYEARTKIHPKRAKGAYRRFKWIIMAITLGIYYLTPWIRWDRGEFAPDQAVLVDIANRRFYAFFIEIWPQEFYFVAGLLVMAGVGLFLVTSVVGRAWCGYTCPQTVWTDLFLVVERFFEGDRNARIKLDNAPWSFDKLYKRTLKHITWLVIAVATGGAWIFYFADAPTLLLDLFTGQGHSVAYGTVAVLTATTYIFGGHMREQVCNYMCPWPRIQAAMLDEDSLVVTYNDWRGEPRTRGRKRAENAGLTPGDCVDCNACVTVCPAGIDIRDGQQMECITCALCIDACDDIMGKLGREKGLISYSTLRDYNTNMALATNPQTDTLDPSLIRQKDGQFIEAIRHFNWRILVRPRTLIYLAAWACIGLGLVFALTQRDRMSINVQHDRNPVYVLLKDASYRNSYTIKLLNMIPEKRVIFLSLEGLPGGTMRIPGVDQPEGVSFAIPVEPDRVRAIRVFVRQSSRHAQNGGHSFRFIAEDKQSNETDTYEAVFNTPEVGT
ncbi:MAG: cytochrome c oxidase accessory protein CcoG [Pseudomonadota bacterium]